MSFFFSKSYIHMYMYLMRMERNNDSKFLFIKENEFIKCLQNGRGWEKFWEFFLYMFLTPKVYDGSKNDVEDFEQQIMWVCIWWSEIQKRFLVVSCIECTARWNFGLAPSLIFLLIMQPDGQSLFATCYMIYSRNLLELLLGDVGM